MTKPAYLPLDGAAIDLTVHPLRDAALDEIHARPFHRLAAPRRLMHFAFQVNAEEARRDREAMAEAVEQAVERFGRLDIVVANAGVTPIPATIRTMDLDDFDRVLAINLTGVVNTVAPAVDEVVARSGHIVVVASVAAFAPGFAGVAYMASKAAVEQFGRALRIELGITDATAGVAYFGVVQTSMVKNALDDDPLGHEIDMMMPFPLRQRISAAQAATVIVDGITNRSARTIAPKSWGSYSLMREVVNRGMEDWLRSDARLHALLRKVEQRHRGDTP
jgi:NAD(P)-dependent dehydrogenase (short-subunit alcohol dehydrogenase family)